VSDWTAYDGENRPADDVWVEVEAPYNRDTNIDLAAVFYWGETERFRILNQHLIDAARLEGIRLGLEAAVREIVERVELASTTDGGDEWLRPDHMLADVRGLNPATIAKETDQ
jgi:hypothetical protein